MLILPNGKTIKSDVALSENVTQLLIDSEIFFLSICMVYDLRCIPCFKSGMRDAAYCQGSVNDDCTAFTVECGCSVRVGRGAFTAPMPPTPMAPRENRDEKRVYHLSRDEMRQIAAFEQALDSLKLQYLARCPRCRMENNGSDGIRGRAESNDMRQVFECDCSVREYKGSEVPLAAAH